MTTTPAMHVQTEVRGDVPKAAAELAAAKVRSLQRVAPGPVLFARVTLTMAADPAVERPATARANLDLNGRLIRAQAVAVTWHEAVERMSDRLRARLERAARNRAAIRGSKPGPQPHEWRHGSIPMPRRPYFPRVPEERAIIRRTSYGLARQTPGEAAADLELLGYDFHLFIDEATGQDSVIYRADGGYRTAQARQVAGRPGPVGASITVSGRPVPGLAPAVAAGRLEALGQPFVFFVNSETGRGSLIYHRYDGHYGLITPAGVESPPEIREIV
jgi:Sigma 54 modulation/S30EA ribosomal protein C terminus/Sigma 54 modulation protein / S30EA ribosomal protein